MRKEKAPKFKKDFADDEDEGGVTDLRRIDEDAGDDDHNRTMKIILSGLEATAILEQDAAKKKSQVDINSRLAKPSARFRLFGQADEVEGTHQPHLPPTCLQVTSASENWWLRLFSACCPRSLGFR